MSKRAQSKGLGTILGTYPFGSGGVTKSILCCWGMAAQWSPRSAQTLFRKQLILVVFTKNPADWSRLENNVASMTS
ncbi:MAG: hypothetical protein LBI76_04910 [Comamonas sp.]|nr:hypothetical protein [Comamonas sp.]